MPSVSNDILVGYSGEAVCVIITGIVRLPSDGVEESVGVSMDVFDSRFWTRGAVKTVSSTIALNSVLSVFSVILG